MFLMLKNGFEGSKISQMILLSIIRITYEYENILELVMIIKFIHDISYILASSRFKTITHDRNRKHV